MDRDDEKQELAFYFALCDREEIERRGLPAVWDSEGNCVLGSYRYDRATDQWLDQHGQPTTLREVLS